MRPPDTRDCSWYFASVQVSLAHCPQSGHKCTQCRIECVSPCKPTPRGEAKNVLKPHAAAAAASGPYAMLSMRWAMARITESAGNAAAVVSGSPPCACHFASVCTYRVQQQRRAWFESTRLRQKNGNAAVGKPQDARHSPCRTPTHCRWASRWCCCARSSPHRRCTSARCRTCRPASCTGCCRSSLHAREAVVTLGSERKVTGTHELVPPQVHPIPTIGVPSQLATDAEALAEEQVQVAVVEVGVAAEVRLQRVAAVRSIQSSVEAAAA